MRRSTEIFLKSTGVIFIFFAVYVLVNSALDIYNNFAYDKAILRESPYGYSPLLEDPKNYGSTLVNIKSGDFVYVEEWLSAYNGRIVFAKVKSKLNSGYVNKDMLVQANINVKPIISVLLLSFMFALMVKKLYNKMSLKQIV